MNIAAGAVLVVLAWGLAGLICVSVWMGFTLRGLIRMTKGTGGPWASAMAQISVIAMLAGLLRFGPTWGIAAVLFPPGLLLFVSDIAELAITRQIALYALPATFIALGLTLSVARLRPFAIILAGLILLVTTLVSGEVLSSRAMCALAAEQGLTNVTRNSFVWSIPNSGNEYQFNLHAMGQHGEDYVAWSYSEMDWYLLPDTIWNNVQSSAPACGT